MPAGLPGAGGDRDTPTAATVRGAVLAAALLPAWALAVVADALGLGGGVADVGANHLLFAGVACTAIAAAVPQFLVVWSETPLRLPRAAVAAAPLVAAGTVALAGSLLVGAFEAVAVGGALLAAGLWTLAAVTALTLAPVRPWDATERCLFAGTATLAVGAIVGLAIGADYAAGVLPLAGVGRPAAVAAHATLMVVGGVLSVGYGGLFRLSSMLTGARSSAAGDRVVRGVSLVHPASAALLAAARLVGARPAALVAAAGVVASAVAVGAVVARRLRAGGESSAATRRYRAVAAGLPLWGAAAGVRWAAEPLARPAALGGPVAERLLWAAIALLVVGSLYHVGPFLVWLERYADRLGLEPVPDVEELFDRRIERLDGVALPLGVALLVAAAAGGPRALAPLGGGLLLVAGLCLVVNLTLVVRDHTSWTPLALLRGTAADP